MQFRKNSVGGEGLTTGFSENPRDGGLFLACKKGQWAGGPPPKKL